MAGADEFAYTLLPHALTGNRLPGERRPDADLPHAGRERLRGRVPFALERAVWTGTSSILVNA